MIQLEGFEAGGNFDGASVRQRECQAFCSSAQHWAVVQASVKP